MRQLRITRNGLELASVSLKQPVSMVGRSPSCDGILRAPGVAAVQFMLESQGEGTDQWIIFDVSDESGEGKVVGLGKVEFRGFFFEISEAPLDPAEQLGGGIHRSLREGAASTLQAGSKSSLVEAVRIRRDSGAVQEVSHLRVPKGALRPKKLRPFEEIPFVELHSEREKVQLHYRTLPQKSSNSPESLRLQRNTETLVLKPNSSTELGVRDWIRLEWGGDDLYFRWVSAVAPVAVRREVIGIPFLRWGMLAGLLFALAIGGSIWWKSQKEPEPVVVAPPRVATIEVKEAPPPPPPPPVNAMPLQPQAEKSQQKQPSKSGAAAAARFEKPAPEKQRSQSGLNAPAPTTNVNAIGLLGALKSSAPAQGPGVRADQIFNDSMVTQAVASKESGSIALKNPPSGVLGVGPSGGAPRAKGDGLQALSTTISGANQYAPSEVGAIGRPGGKGKGLGSGLSGLDSLGGDGDGKGQFAGFDSSGTDVRGGLDRETVRRVIVSNRGKIRACYERALLAQPKLAGRVVTRFQISATGPVVSASMGSSDANSPTLESCLLEVVRAMEFPAAATGKPTFVIYPFVFQARSN